MRYLHLAFLFLLSAGINYSQSVRSVVPDTGSQGAAFPIVVHGTGTEWTLSPYFVVNFDSLGVGTNPNSVVIVNDTTLTADLFIDGKASLGFHKCIVADEYNNVYTKDSAFKVFLGAPVAPTLLLPFNNSTNIVQNPYFLWDSNIYASTYRIQIASDSNFSNMVFDTVLANTPYTLRLGVLALDNSYFWRVNAANPKGTSPWSTVFKFRVRAVGITNISSEIPQNYNLFPNYPNPFNAMTKIRFQIPKSGIVKLKIYDLTGREISNILDQNLSPGIYEFLWNASSLPSGIYFYTMEAGEHREVKKAVLLK